jgi:TetR/AcrR family transcriptional regulator
MQDSKVKQIIEAAKKRFAHYGLSKTTMNEIASDIGMSKASLYYYFVDKEKLFIAVVENDMQEFVRQATELMERPIEPSSKLKKYVSLRNDLLLQLLNLSKVQVTNASDLFNPVYDELRKHFFEQEKQLITKILNMGIDENEFAKITIDHYAHLFVSSLIGLRVTSLTNPVRDLSAQELMDRQTNLFVEIFLASIRKNG